MHPNPTFRKTDGSIAQEFARNRGFGTLTVNGPTAPILAHVPFLFSESDAIELHLMRSNPIWRALADPCPAVLAVTGPDGYISPDWYGAADQVPTWNYIAVHLSGTLQRLEQNALRGILDRLSAEFETRIEGKPPWTSAKMSPEVLDRMMRMIAPCRFIVEDVQSTFKLGQNKPDDVRASAAAKVVYGIGSELSELSDLMANPPKPKV